MKLHEDQNAFRVLLEKTHERSDFRVDVLEKDYYVVLILKELADKQQAGLPVFFKGGTALYKALKATNRFSEDIDLSVDTRGCSRTQNDKRLEQATKKYSSLNRVATEGRTNRSEVISVYTYDPITVFDANDALQRFGKLRIEATSFTISEPVEQLMISPLLYDLASGEEQKILREQYNVAPFSVLTITMERIFIDKLFAAEAYLRRSSDPHHAFEAAKHIYDLAIMIRQPRIEMLLSDARRIKQLLDIRMEEEAGRLDGIPGVIPAEFRFFDLAESDDNVRKAYDTMQSQYVLRQEDRIEYAVAIDALHRIKQQLWKNLGWVQYKPSVLLMLRIKQEEADRLNQSSSASKSMDEKER